MKGSEALNDFKNELYGVLKRNRHLLNIFGTRDYIGTVNAVQTIVGFPENRVKKEQDALWVSSYEGVSEIPSHVRFLDSPRFERDLRKQYRLPAGLLSLKRNVTMYGHAYIKIYRTMMAMHKICTVKGYGKNIATIIMRAMCETGPAYADEWAGLPKKIKI